MPEQNELSAALAEGLTAARHDQQRLAAERRHATETMQEQLQALLGRLETAADATRLLRAAIRAAQNDPAKIAAIDFDLGDPLRVAYEATLTASATLAGYLHLMAGSPAPAPDVL